MTHPALLEQAALELRRAVVIPGPQPQWHRSVIARHRAEWPTLWDAIDAVLVALDVETIADVPMPDADHLEQALLEAARESYGDQLPAGAFEVEPDPGMRCGAPVAGFSCTRPLGHDGAHWSTGTTTIDGS